MLKDEFLAKYSSTELTSFRADLDELLRSVYLQALTEAAGLASLVDIGLEAARDIRRVQFEVLTLMNQPNPRKEEHA